MNPIFPVDLIEEIQKKKTSSSSSQSTAENVGDTSSKDRDKPSLANLDSEGDSQTFSNNLTSFLLSTKENPNREEKIEKANQLGLVN
jgi:hypothetical protein